MYQGTYLYYHTDTAAKSQAIKTTIQFYKLAKETTLANILLQPRVRLVHLSE